VSDEESAKVTDESLDTVLAVVHDAVTELEAVRQRKTVEDAAYDNCGAVCDAASCFEARQLRKSRAS